MNKLIVGGAVAVALMAGPAIAADMPVRPPPLVVDSWTGFYAGVSLGGRFSDSNWSTTCLSPGAAGAVGCPLNVIAQNGPRFANDNPSGFSSATFRPAGYLGYNWQIGSWVVGAEGDFAWGKTGNSMKAIPGAEIPGAVNTDTSSVRTTWDASARARAGMLLGSNIVLYATGGASWIHMEVEAFCGTPRPADWCAGPAGGASNIGRTTSASETRIGWTVGAGAEAMLWSNWLTRIEYRYADYGTFSYTLFPGVGACGVGCDTINAETTLRTHTVLVGFAYKFGGPFAMGY
jgi:outer membrane immunogenic protein